MATRDEQRQQPLPLHILFLLFFAPGHLIPVVDMAAIFSTHGAWCTILTKRPAMWAFHKDNDAADQMSFGEMLVLSPPALGGFVTHCGWNSVLEAVSAGVPMVTWPRCWDQFYNEKLIVEVLKVGVSIGAKVYASPLETHEVIGGEVIAGSIGRLMGSGEEGDAVQKKAKDLSVKARSAMAKGGSSYDDIGRLMDELMTRRSFGTPAD
uniref:Flavonol-3-O-glycoside-7-O-glucosyltransferase 1 n=1 Tax=Aegilops tauschii TaxID=37682 RepID=N1QYU1_AEGTA